MNLKRIGWVGAGLVLILAGVYLANQLSGLPAPKTGNPGNLTGAVGPLRVLFAQPVDHASAEGHLKVVEAGGAIQGKVVWQDKTLSFWPADPLADAATVTVQVEAGVRAQDGRVLHRAVEWQVRVRPAEVVFLTSSKAPDLWRVNLEGVLKRITHTGGNVFDYAVSPDGETLVYSAYNDLKGLDLWQVDREGGSPTRLLGCGADLCSTPAFSPDGAQLVYSRRRAGASASESPGLPRMWTLSLPGRVSREVTGNPAINGSEPTWSPDGAWLAFRDDAARAIHAYNLSSGETLSVPSELGATAIWEPDSRGFYFLNTAAGDLTFAIVMKFDLPTRQTAPAVGLDAQLLDYATPGLSPDGAWMAVGLRSSTGDPARQIWLMHPDGSARTEVTHDPVANHAAYQWDAQGARLVFQKLRLDCSCNLPQVVVWQRDTGETRTLADDAIFPRWLP